MRLYMAWWLNNKHTFSDINNVPISDTVSDHFLFSITTAALWRGVQASSPDPSVPDRVRALVGSCVMIPCSFTPAASRSLKGRRERVEVRLRFRGGGHIFPLRSTAFNSEDRDQVSRDFLGRTSLFGKVADGDCSLKIERISLDDSRVYEISLKKGDDLLWGRPRSFNLDVVGKWGSHLYCLFLLV